MAPKQQQKQQKHSQQTSMTSFFGAVKTKKKATTKEGAENTTPDDKTSPSSPASSTDSKRKNREKIDNIDNDKEEEIVAEIAAAAVTNNKTKKRSKKKRRVIEDSDSEDDNDPMDTTSPTESSTTTTTSSSNKEKNTESSENEKKQESSVKDDVKEAKESTTTKGDDDKKSATATATAPITKATEEKPAAESNKEEEEAKSNKESNSMKAAAAATTTRKKATTEATTTTTTTITDAKKKKKKEATDADSSTTKNEDKKKAAAANSDKSSKKQQEEASATSPDEPKKKKAATTKRTKNTTIKSDILKAAKNAIASDAAILKEIAATWPETGHDDTDDDNDNDDDDEDDDDLPYLVLCQAFDRINNTTKRLEIQEIMTTLLRQVLLRSSRKNKNGNHNHKNLQAVLYLASNSVAPAYECVELGIGDSLLIKAIGEATGTSSAIIKQKYEAVGDLGTVATTFKAKQKTLGGFFAVKQAAAPTTANNANNKKKKKKKSTVLTVQEVLQVFREIAKTKGNQSQKWKVDKIKRLVVKSSSQHGALETKFIIRGLQGKLRIGLAQSTVLIAVAHALSLTIPPTIVMDEDDENNDDDDLPEEARQYQNKELPYEKRLEAAVAIVKKAYSEVPSYDALLDAGLSVPLYRMYKACTLTPGIPVAPMLAKPTKSIQEVLKRLTGLAFTCEYKYDGERAQVHLLPDGSTKVFSRNLLDTSEKFPEVPLFVKEAIDNSNKEGDTKKPVESFVLDAEVVAFNTKTGQLVPFQVLSTRKKTLESGEEAKVKVIVQAFDLMYLNGKSLLNQTLRQRRELLQQHFTPVEGKFQFAVSLDHKENGETDVVEEFLDLAVKGQCEGLMIKTLDDNANYEPSKRSLNWLKLKKDYLQGLGDSVDLVPLGAYHGKGKRTGVYGAYLLACYDADTEEYQSVCKIGTGFSDQDLVSLAESLNKHAIPTKNSQYNVSDQLACDVWFDTAQVWEVKAADLSTSSAHRGAQGKLGDEVTDRLRGIGLRFPRFERLRDDKRPHEATTSDQILEMYYNQDTIAATNGAGCGDDDDDDMDDGI